MLVVGGYNGPMIEIAIDNASFTYDGKRNALDGVSLRIGPGEFVCIVGGNGSGKSTLARHMNGLTVPDSGEVRVGGVPTSDVPGAYHARRNVGMVFQSPDDALVATLVKDDVAFGPRNLGLAREEIEERVAQALADVGLAGCGERDTVALSGGEKQRVAIAGVLAMRPSAIVFDEATAMLDPAGKDGILEVAMRLRSQGLAIVWVTHLMDEVARAATRVVALRDGAIAFDGAPADLFADGNLLEDLGLRAPYAVRLAAALRDQGVNLAPEDQASSDPAALARAICAAFGK